MRTCPRRFWPAACFVVGCIVLSSWSAGAEPTSTTNNQSGVSAFGRVFERHRSTLVRVKVRTDEERWVSGFLIGGEGEIVFGLDRAPTGQLTVEGPRGRSHAAQLLGFDRGLGLGVGRLAEPWRGIAPLSAPPDVRTPRPEQWVVILGHDRRGRAVPHAGVVTGRAQKGKDGYERVSVDVPGARGRPILDAKGRLLGIAVAKGRRRTKMVTLRSVQPFLRRVVLGGR